MNMMQKLTSERTGGSITNIIVKFKKYNLKRWDYCDKIIQDEPETFLDYLFNKDVTPIECELISELCEERAVQLYEMLRPETTYKGFIKMIRKDEPRYAKREEHDIYVFHRRIYNLNTVSNLLRDLPL
jgi:hypothetical protein